MTSETALVNTTQTQHKHNTNTTQTQHNTTQTQHINTYNIYRRYTVYTTLYTLVSDTTTLTPTLKLHQHITHTLKHKIRYTIPHYTNTTHKGHRCHPAKRISSLPRDAIRICINAGCCKA